MADDETGGPALASTQEQRVILVQSLAVTWDVLDHLRAKGVLADQLEFRADAGCCKPDAGTCCVNKQVMVEQAPR